MNPSIPPVQQKLTVRANIKKLTVGDSVVFGTNRLGKITEILSTDDNSPTPHFTVSIRGKEYRIFKNQIKHVILKSKDEYEDLGEPDFSVLRAS